MKDYIRFLKFVKPHLYIMVVAMICMIISSVMGGVSIGSIIPIVDSIIADKTISIANTQHTPQFVLNFVDKVNNIPKVLLLKWIVIFMVLGSIIREVGLFFQTYFMNKLGHATLKDVREAIYKKLLSLSTDFYSNKQTGELVSRVTFDVGTIVNSITEGLTDLLLQPIQLLVYIYILITIKIYFSISWMLILIIVFVVPFLAYPVIQIGKKLRKISTATQQSMSDINSLLFESIYGIGIIKCFSAEDYQLDKFKKHNHRYYKMILKSVKRMALISPIGELMGIFCIGAVLWIVGKDVVSGQLSAGAFIAFLTALLLLIKPLKRLSKLYGVNLQAQAAIVRVFNILDREPSVKDKPCAVPFPDFKDSIEFKNIGFSYDKEKPVLRDINVVLPKGKVMAIVGSSGAGKSTFVNLLPRFYDPDKGGIFIDGKDIRDFNIASLREKMGIVTQETILFNDSVRNNIAFGKPDADINNVIKAAKAANAHDFILKMPDGYNTFIGDRGMRISGGEKQRIAIARALFKDPPILILDEATSQLDTESEMLVQEAINRLMSNRTVLVIAHRLSTVDHADNIIVIENSRVIESGKHKELFSNSGIYKRLYGLQFLAEK